MRIDIPTSTPWRQLNDGDWAGSIWSSRNIDLKRNRGSVTPSHKLIVTTDSTGTDTTFVEATDGTVTWGATKNGLLEGFFIDPFDSGTPPTLQASWEVSGTSTDTLTKEITVPAGNNQVLVVVPMAGDTVSATVPGAVASATFNTSESITLGSGSNAGCGDNVRVRVRQMYLVAPTQTTADVVVTWSAANPEVSAQIFLFSDAAQSSPLSGHYTVETTTGGATALNFDDDGDPIPNTGYANHYFLQLCMSSQTTHTHSEGSAQEQFETNVGTMTYSSALLGDTRYNNPQDLAVAFAKEQGTVNAIAGTRWWAAAGTDIYQTTTENGDFEVDDSSSMPTTEGKGSVDIKAFNSKLYVASEDTLWSRSGTSYSTVTSSLPNDKKILELYQDRLYIASDDQVDSMDAAETIATTTYTLDLTGPQFENQVITSMRATSAGLVIGTLDRNGGRAFVHFWDGTTQDTLEKSVMVDASIIVAMTVKDDVPYILDNRGILSAYNGSFFQEVARFDFDLQQPIDFDRVTSNNRWIHPNGMQTINGEILMAINSKPNDANDLQPVRHPAGIYAYDPDYGITHKYSFTAQDDSATVTDQGQIQIEEVGALFNLQGDEENDDRTDMSDFFAACAYKSDNSTTVYTIAKNDKRGLDINPSAADEAGVIITTKIRAEQIREEWEKFYAFIRPFENSTDKIVVKYRRQEHTPVETDITWVNTTSFTSTDSDWAAIKTIFDANGKDSDYEVEGLQGDGAGFISHITDISESGGTYTVTLDETITGATTNTARVRVDRWNKIGTFTDSVEDFHEFNPEVASTWIQFKVYMIGDNIQLERILSKSSVAQEI